MNTTNNVYVARLESLQTVLEADLHTLGMIASIIAVDDVGMCPCKVAARILDMY